MTSIASACLHAPFKHPVAILLGILSLSILLQQTSTAGTFTLVDENSSMFFDTSDPNEPTNAQDWIVDGVNQLYEQSFWFRVGSGPEISLHSLPILTEGTSDVNFDGDDETLYVQYDGGTFDIEVVYILDGGLPGSGVSDLAEQISVNSRTGVPLDFHFFQYTDYEVGGTAADDIGLFTNLNAVQQGDAGVQLNETVITPVPSHRELGVYPSIRDKLTDGLPTTLSDTPAIGTLIGPDDLTWAFQWDFTLQANSTFQISKDKNLRVIPEPASLLLFASGLCVLCVRRK